jgi:Rha family phage regulatory protein
MTFRKEPPAEERDIVPVVTLCDQQIVTDSLNVAAVFGKQHKYVLEAIRRMDVPEDFGRPNFRPSEYMNAQGKMQPMFKLTRDGFTLMAMGFTGPKAMRFKLAYISAFNAMEKELAGRERRDLDPLLDRMNARLETV